MTQEKAYTQYSWCFPKRIAYVVNHSFPYCSDGYAVRTHEVARALGDLGHDVLVINRPGRPWDIEGFPQDTTVAPSQTVDAVRYLFLPSSADDNMTLRAQLRQAEKTLLDAFEVFRPGAVIAVSNWENAEPALYATRRWGAPFFYEQRGFWEMSQAAQDAAYVSSPAYQNAQDIELRIAQSARAVFTLNDAMRNELITRGVQERKIQLVPNGVSKPSATNRAITREALGCQAKYLLGYIGSLADYEGQEELLEVLKLLRAQGMDVDLLVVGSNAPKGLIASDHGAPAENGLLVWAEQMGLAGHIHVTGRVPVDEVGSYYRLLDAMVMPRRRAAVTELVAPLKPYAAAAYNVPVFMPDMPPLDEVAQDINGSLYPEGNLTALATMLRNTLEQGGHPAILTPLPARTSWRRRVQPMSSALRAATDGLAGPENLVMRRAGDPTQLAMSADSAGVRFDTHRLPRVALRGRSGTTPVCAIGPCTHLPEDTQITYLTRSNILSELATRNIGRFIIDWNGLRDHPGEWEGLWSIENMRLNRLIMDACKIGLDRGWELQVVGPIARSRAPLFRTVSQVFTETLPEHAGEAS